MILCISGKVPSQRRRFYPKRFNLYWDMNIPTEYYEEKFIEFENYLTFTMQRRPEAFQSLNVNDDFYLDQFRKFEKISEEGKQEVA